MAHQVCIYQMKAHGRRIIVHRRPNHVSPSLSRINTPGMSDDQRNMDDRLNRIEIKIDMLLKAVAAAGNTVAGNTVTTSGRDYWHLRLAI